MSNHMNRLAGWTVVLVVLIDWFTKFWVQNRLVIYERLTIVDGWVALVHLQNKGVAFGLLNREAVWQTTILVLLAVFAIIGLYQFARSTPEPNTRFGAALIIGGAVGNLGDRIANGGVTDFVHVSFFPYVFNFADAAVTVGAILLAATLILAKPPITAA